MNTMGTKDAMKPIWSSWSSWTSCSSWHAG